MANASNVQTDFLGGEWSPYAQGRLDDPEYKRGMNVCRNVIPIEAGAATRRTGTKQLAFTRNGQQGRLLNFQFNASTPYTMEFTDGFLRFYDSQRLVLAEEPRAVQYINQACPAVMVTSTTCADTWAEGNTVIFNSLKPDPSGADVLSGKQFMIRAGADDNHWTLFDSLTGQPLDGATVAWNANMAIQVARVFEIATPYVNGDWENLRATQSDNMVFLWHPNHPPYVVFAPIDGGNLFTFGQANFKDGPYLDPPTDGSYLTVSGQSGSITVGIAYPAWSNSVTYANGTNFAQNTQSRGPGFSTNISYSNGAVVSSGGNLYVSIQDGNLNHSPPNATWWKLAGSGQTFAATDVGRLIRLFAEPAPWAAGTSYTTNQLVKYPAGINGAYYVALQNSTGKVPGADPDNWGVAANAAAWTWGIITAYSSPVSVTVAIQGDPLLYNQNVLTWRLGAFSATTGYPSCGAFHEGRLWAAGSLDNRFDASGTTGDIFNFAPTASDGTVADSNAISYVLKSKQRNKILWMNPALGGILMGTAQSEWLTQSSQNNDPITPTNIQSHDHTSIGSANVEAVRCGTTVAFVQRYGNQVIEYLADLFSGKPAGKNLALRAKHLTGKGIVRMGYQMETYPVLWMLTADGKLLGTSYKRESLMVSQPPNFNGWHRHDLGSGFSIVDLVVGSAPGGLYETATIMTQDPKTGWCRVEAITDAFQETDALPNAFFTDSGIVPKGGSITTINTVQGILFGGLGALEGKTVSAFIAGLDCGDYTVTNGQIFVPLQSDPDKLLTVSLLAAFNSVGLRYEVTIVNPSVSITENIMQFPPISSTILNNFTYLNYGSQAIADYANDRVTFMLPGTNPQCGLIQYRISTGAFIQYATTSQIFGAPNPPFFDNTLSYTETPKVVGSDNFIYTLQVTGSVGVDPTSAGQTDWFKNQNGLGDPSTLPGAYNSGTTYSIDQYVTSAGFIYRSLQNSNLNHTPASSPTFWQPYYATPSAWSATTVYGTFAPVTGSDNKIYWPLGNVTPGLGDPSTFSTDNNPYWQTAGGVWQVGIITTSGIGLDNNGDIWMFQSGTSFHSTFVKIDGSTLKVKGVVTKDNSLTIPAPSNVIVPMTVQDNNGVAFQQYMLYTVDTTPSGSNSPAAVVIDANGLRVNAMNTVVFDEGNHPAACPGNSQPGWSSAFVVTRLPNGQPVNQAIGLYEVNATLAPPTMVRNNALNFLIDPNKVPKLLYSSTASVSKRKAGTMLPTTFDSSWTYFAGVSAPMYDPNDGNIMFFVSTLNPSNWNSGTTYGNSNGLNDGAVGSDGKVYQSKTTGNINHDPTTDGGVHWTLVNNTTATQLQYLVKVSADCAKLLWRVGVTAGPTSGDIGYQFMDMSTGYLTYLESLGLGNWQVRRVDTLAGVSTIVFPGQGGVTQLGNTQVVNSKTGDMIMYVTYDHSGSGTTPPPATVNPVGGTTPNNFTGWARMNVTPKVEYIVSGVVGFTYTSQGQLLRPVSPQESGARNGPAFGKSRRNHRYATALANTVGGTKGIGFGTRVTGQPLPNIKSALLATVGGTRYAGNQMYTGEWTAPVEDTYSFDGMLAWEISRPVPATVTALGGFIETNDR